MRNQAYLMSNFYAAFLVRVVNLTPYLVVLHPARSLVHGFKSWKQTVLLSWFGTDHKLAIVMLAVSLSDDFLINFSLVRGCPIKKLN